MYRIETPIDALTHNLCRISHGTITEECVVIHDLPELWKCRCVCVEVEVDHPSSEELLAKASVDLYEHREDKRRQQIADDQNKYEPYSKLEPTAIDRRLVDELRRRLRAAYRLGRAAGFFIGVCVGTLVGVAATVLWVVVLTGVW